jgi:DedD protein
MDTQLKERLTGAGILVALIVLVVPELLSGPPEQPVAVGAVAQQPAVQSYQIDMTHPQQQVTAPASSQVAAGPSSIPLANGAWTVQIGSFASRGNAQKLVTELTDKGYDAFMLAGGGRNGLMYRVRVGRLAQRDAATALATQLQAAGYAGSVTTH